MENKYLMSTFNLLEGLQKCYLIKIDYKNVTPAKIYN
jgi:hypothetical protein